eukprot:489724-Ditylum_brightwellii.AAC.1
MINLSPLVNSNANSIDDVSLPMRSIFHYVDPEREEDVVDQAVGSTSEEEEDPKFVKCVRDKPV